MLKKIATVAITIGAIFLLSGCGAKPTATIMDQNITLNSIKQLNIFKSPQIKLNAFEEHESLYHVKGYTTSQRGSTAFEAFITKDLKEVVFGKGFSMQTKEPLQVKMDMKPFLKDETYSIGSGKDEYIVFTDPECPYCHRLEKILPLLKKNAKFHIFLYPLSFHKNARQMSYYIMSQKTQELKQKATHDIALGNKDYKNFKPSDFDKVVYEEKLKKQFDIASKLCVSGTPAVFNMNGDATHWNLLPSKYNIQEPIDMQGINFLKKNNLIVNLNKTKDVPPLYVFTSLEKKNLSRISKTLKKNKKNRSIQLVIKLDKKSKTLQELKAVYMQKSNDKRVSILMNLINGKPLSKELLNKAKKLSRDVETRYLPVSFVMQKMKLDANADYLMIDSQGNIVND